MTGQPTVPYVFIGGEFIGGYDGEFVVFVKEREGISRSWLEGNSIFFQREEVLLVLLSNAQPASMIRPVSISFNQHDERGTAVQLPLQRILLHLDA
jgi:hypothetical protein